MAKIYQACNLSLIIKQWNLIGPKPMIISMGIFSLFFKIIKVLA
jgi:hypothetical protein